MELVFLYFLLFLCVLNALSIGRERKLRLSHRFTKNNTLLGSLVPTSSLSSAKEMLESGDRIGIIIIDHGSRRKEANDMLLQVSERFKAQSGYSIVEAAHMEMAEPSIQEAYDRCIQQGANLIVCHPYFLSFGKHVRDDIPSLVEEAAKRHPGSRFTITDPLGVQEGIVGLIMQAVQNKV